MVQALGSRPPTRKTGWSLALGVALAQLGCCGIYRANQSVSVCVHVHACISSELNNFFTSPTLATLDLCEVGEVTRKWWKVPHGAART